MKRVEFFFDLTSPYSYLASTQIEAVAARNGATVEWRPFVLGAVLKASGNTTPAACPPKAKWMVDDLGRWAKLYGVPFSFSPFFPANSIKGLRLVLVAQRAGAALGVTLSHAAFRAMWAEARDIATAPVLAALAASVGMDPAASLAATDEPEIKDQLRANTDEALRRGAFGAPSIFVGDELQVGNDRLPFVEAALRAQG